MKDDFTPQLRTQRGRTLLDAFSLLASSTQRIKKEQEPKDWLRSWQEAQERGVLSNRCKVVK